MPPVSLTAQRHTFGSLAKTGAFRLNLAIIVVVLAAALKKPADLLVWKSHFETELGASLGALVLASTLVERVVEVFLSIWQRPQVDSLEQELEFWQSIQGSRHTEIQTIEARLADTINPLPDDVKAALQAKRKKKEDELDEAETAAERLGKALVPYDAETRRLAMWIGMAVGVLVAAVGVRILGNLVEIDKAKMGISYSWFVFVDVLVTGAVLAGGSKGVHGVASLLGTVLDAGQARAGNQKNTQGPPSPPVSH